jgi:hypothetical protein
MSSKFLKVIFAAVVSIGLIGQANAISISYFEEGEHYTDANGNLWEYLGAFDVGAGLQYIDVNSNGIYDAADGDQFPTPLNALEAAVSLGFGSLDELAISAFVFDAFNGVITEEEFAFFETLFGGDIVEVNFMSWYDGFVGSLDLLAQDIEADKNGDGKYTSGTDRSAYVKDRSVIGDYTNYVFKSVSVPEPSTFAIFALALFVLGARRLKS